MTRVLLTNRNKSFYIVKNMYSKNLTSAVGKKMSSTYFWKSYHKSCVNAFIVKTSQYKNVEVRRMNNVMLIKLKWYLNNLRQSSGPRSHRPSRHTCS